MKRNLFHFLMVGLTSVSMLSSHNVKAASSKDQKPSAPMAPITSYVTYNTVWYDEQQTSAGEYDHTKTYRPLSSFVVSFFAPRQSEAMAGLSISSNLGVGNPRHCIRLLEHYVKQYATLKCIKINRNCGLTPEFWQETLNILSNCKALEFLYISKDARPKEWRTVTTLTLEEKESGIQTPLLLLHEPVIDDYFKTLLVMNTQPHEHRALIPETSGFSGLSFKSLFQ